MKRTILALKVNLLTKKLILDRIKVVLTEHNKTGKWLSKELGVNPATVSKWCTNTSQPTLETLLKIAELLEVNYTELVRAESVTSPKN